MIITCKKGAPQNEVEKIVKGFEEKGLEVNTILGTNYNVFGIVGDTTVVDEKMVRANPWIEDVTRIAAPYKKVNRLFHPEDSIIDVAGIKVGGKEKVVVIGGPCSVEGKEQICEIAEEVKQAGGCMLRGGAYKAENVTICISGTWN